MTNQRPLNDPYEPTSGDEARRAASLDRELQPDPELAEGRASGGRIALFAVAVAIVLGAVFYGLNNTSSNPNGSTAQAPVANQNTAQTQTPVPPGVRDVTPRNNTAPGVTTGAAPAQPQQPAGNPTPPASK